MSDNSDNRNKQAVEYIPRYRHPTGGKNIRQLRKVGKRRLFHIHSWRKNKDFIQRFESGHQRIHNGQQHKRRDQHSSINSRRFPESERDNFFLNIYEIPHFSSKLSICLIPSEYVFNNGIEYQHQRKQKHSQRGSIAHFISDIAYIRHVCHDGIRCIFRGG